MPKKYKQKSLLTKPTSSSPLTLSSSKALPSQDAASTRTVNDLIHESRRGAGHERPTSVATTSSIPPSLRAVLDLPAPLPPAPRIGLRGPTRLRRIPGPAPPRSWLTDSIHAPREVKNIPWSRVHTRSRLQKQSSNLPEGNFPSERSLQHVVLKRLASDWSWHAEYDHGYLAELPTKLKQSLLSYIAIYGEGQGPNPLRLLFPLDLSRDEHLEVRRLDLANAIGGWSTLRRIEKELEGEKVEPQRSEQKATDEGVPDSWDENDMMEPSVMPAVRLVVNMRFSNLKHLSLAVAPGTTGAVASWALLLGLVGKLSTITSLSLAHWPQPTYTPNASTSMVKIQASGGISTPSVTYGGTNFYSALDNDWREAAGILRALSRSLYCLRWLDLTGCGSWFPALVWESTQGQDEFRTKLTGPDWNGSWRGIEHLVLAVGWSPGPIPSPLHASSRTSCEITAVARSGQDDMDDHMSTLLARLSSTRLGSHQIVDASAPESWDVEFEREKYYHRQEVEHHATMERNAKIVAQKLRGLRRQQGGRWIDIDFGFEV